MEKQFWKSKKFWASVAAVLIPMSNHFLGWNMDHNAIVTMMASMIAYIFGQGMADMGKNSKK